MSASAYLIFVIVALLAFVLGAVGAYFYYRARHREAVTQLEALDQDLAEREEELHRLQYQFTNTHPGAPSRVQTESRHDMQLLRHELEQKKNDYNILKQDFDLEIGVLKQELEQLREEKSDVEHSRRHLARKEAELEKRDTALRQREDDVAERSEELKAKIADRTAQMEDEIAAWKKRMEGGLAERDRQIRAREIALEEEREELERQRRAVREKLARIDKDILELPTDKFTSRQEAILIKRLRQQIKLQRDELEQLQRLYHQASVDPETKDRGEKQSVSGAEADAEPAEAALRRGVYPPPAASERTEGLPFGRDEGDSFPAYSTLSSYVKRGREPGGGSVVYDDARDALPERRDDLTLLPGVDPQVQRALYELGITTFDQIARWSSADVRRVSERLNVDKKTVQDHWIINAQSHLFSRKAE